MGCSGPVEHLGFESSCTSERIRGKRPRSQAPVRLSRSQTRSGLMTLRARYRRSPEGCSPAWRCPTDVMCRPGWRRPPANPGGTVGRTRPPPERLKPRRPNTPVLRPGGVHAAHRRRTGLQGAGGASSERPHAAGRGAQTRSDSPANRTGPAPKQASAATRPGTAARAPQGARVCGTARGARLRGSHHLDSDVGAQNPVPVSGHRLVKHDPYRWTRLTFSARAPPIRVRSSCLWAWTCRPRSWRFESCAH